MLLLRDTSAVLPCQDVEGLCALSSRSLLTCRFLFPKILSSNVNLQIKCNYLQPSQPLLPENLALKASWWRAEARGIIPAVVYPLEMCN